MVKNNSIKRERVTLNCINFLIVFNCRKRISFRLEIYAKGSPNLANAKPNFVSRISYCLGMVASSEKALLFSYNTQPFNLTGRKYCSNLSAMLITVTRCTEILTRTNR